MFNRAFTVSVSCFLDANLDLIPGSLDNVASLPSVLPSKGASISGLSARKDSCQSACAPNAKHLCPRCQVNLTLNDQHWMPHVTAIYLRLGTLLHSTAQQVQQCWNRLPSRWPTGRTALLVAQVALSRLLAMPL